MKPRRYEFPIGVDVKGKIRYRYSRKNPILKYGYGRVVAKLINEEIADLIERDMRKKIRK